MAEPYLKDLLDLLDRLALKLPPRRRAALLAEGAKPLRYFPGAPVKKDYALLPPALAESDRALAPLIQESLAACLADPGPGSRSRGH